MVAAAGHAKPTHREKGTLLNLLAGCLLGCVFFTFGCAHEGNPSRTNAPASRSEQPNTPANSALAQEAPAKDLFEVTEYLELYNRAFNAAVKETDLKGDDPIVSRIARHIGVDRFDHGRPADVFLRQRDELLPRLSDATLKRFEALFERINKTI